jgi:hypothetical protein
MVSCNVPVLDTPSLLVRVLLVVSNVSDSEDIFLTFDTKVFVDRDTLILLQLETTGFKELRGGGHTNTEDENVRRNRIASFQPDGANLLGVALCPTK